MGEGGVGVGLWGEVRGWTMFRSPKYDDAGPEKSSEHATMFLWLTVVVVTAQLSRARSNLPLVALNIRLREPREARH